MLQFTRAGAVPDPVVLQVRVSRQFPGRLEAGAPIPPRSLTGEELLANIRHFTLGRRGPRTRPCSRLVLSGVNQLPAHEGLGDALAMARSWDIERVILHLGGKVVGTSVPEDVVGQADGVAYVLASPSQGSELGSLVASTGYGGQPLDVTAVVLVDQQTQGAVPELAERIVTAAPGRVVFTSPLTAGAPPVSTRVLVPLLQEAIRPLEDAGIPTGVKGLPACLLGPLRDRLWKSGNRWYVDSAHQRDQALLFFPDVVRFVKPDICRHCSINHSCDGLPEVWSNREDIGPLLPFE